MELMQSVSTFAAYKVTASSRERLVTLLNRAGHLGVGADRCHFHGFALALTGSGCTKGITGTLGQGGLAAVCFSHVIDRAADSW